jgi:ubiquinone/menaquinone biosynthesis C-methylase UbiE
MYTAFASVYDRLMADVDYHGWAEFYHTLLEKYGVTHGKVCECACGTGSFTALFAAMGYQMTGVDASADMLFEASQKARKNGIMVPFVKQDMRHLRLHRQMDAVLCTNDGVNYLEDGVQLSEFFRSAYLALRPGGALIFDLSTPYKLEHILGDSFLGDETEEIAYLWRNHYSKSRLLVELDLAIFLRQKDGSYQRIAEHQKQFVHTSSSLTKLLRTAGFVDIVFYGDKHMEAPGAREKRWHIAARKPLSITEEPVKD